MDGWMCVLAYVSVCLCPSVCEFVWESKAQGEREKQEKKVIAKDHDSPFLPPSFLPSCECSMSLCTHSPSHLRPYVCGCGCVCVCLRRKRRSDAKEKKEKKGSQTDRQTSIFLSLPQSMESQLGSAPPPPLILLFPVHLCSRPPPSLSEGYTWQPGSRSLTPFPSSAPAVAVAV